VVRAPFCLVAVSQKSVSEINVLKTSGDSVRLAQALHGKGVKPLT
jgi:hypothetical protein